MERLRIFFFSGTGNSYRASTWITEEAKAQGLDATMATMTSSAPFPPQPGTLIGLVYPTHGFTAPWHVIKFACRLPYGNNAQAFCFAARAGLKFGPIYPPGISGTAAFLIALILIVKGYRVMGVESVDMPSNWFSLHPIQRTKVHAVLLDRARGRVLQFAGRVLTGEQAWLTWNNLYEFTCGVVLWPISLGYLLAGRFFLAKLFFANTRCNGCGHCAAHCPVGAISMRGKDTLRPFWRYECESCMRCAGFCPNNAIEAGHSWGVLLYLITSVPVGTIALSQFTSFAGLNTILNLGWFYLSLFLSYQVFAVLIRIQIINRLFACTTFTHLSGWSRYREPDTKVNELSETGLDGK